MRKSDLQKHLDQLEAEELRREVLDLYSAIPQVRSYYTMELGSEKQRSRAYKGAMDEISKKFHTKSLRKPRRPRIQKLNALIRRLEDQTVFPHEMIEVYLHTCTCAIDFKIKYGFQSGPLDNCVIKFYKKASTQTVASGLEHVHHDRLKGLQKKIGSYPDLLSRLLH